MVLMLLNLLTPLRLWEYESECLHLCLLAFCLLLVVDYLISCLLFNSFFFLSWSFYYIENDVDELKWLHRKVMPKWRIGGNGSGRSSSSGSSKYIIIHQSEVCFFVVIFVVVFLFSQVSSDFYDRTTQKKLKLRCPVQHIVCT